MTMHLILTTNGRDYAVPFRGMDEAREWHNTYANGPFRVAADLSLEMATDFMSDEADAADADAIDRHTEAGLDSDEE